MNRPDPETEHPDGRAIAAFLTRFADPPAADVARFIAAGRPRELPPGGVFCRLGQRDHELAFVRSGVVRYFVVRADGEEATKDFGFAGGFAVSFGSASCGEPAQVAIDAVVPVHLLVWPYHEIEKLYDTHPEWQRFGRRIAEVLYRRKEARELSFLLDDAAGRYRALQRQFGESVDLIPQYHLASYLGIRPPSLSRLRKSLGVGRAAAHSQPSSNGKRLDQTS